MDKHLKIMKMLIEEIIINNNTPNSSYRVIDNDKLQNVDWGHYDQLLNDDEPIRNDILNAMNKMADEVRHDVVAMTFTDDEIGIIQRSLSSEKMRLYNGGRLWEHVEALLKRFDR